MTASLEKLNYKPNLSHNQKIMKTSLTFTLLTITTANAINREGREIDISCNTCADCVVQDVGNCCGASLMCTNQAYAPDLGAVDKWCGDNMSSCGWEDIDACACVDGVCVGKQKIEADFVECEDGGVSSSGVTVKDSGSGDGEVGSGVSEVGSGVSEDGQGENGGGEVVSDNTNSGQSVQNPVESDSQSSTIGRVFMSAGVMLGALSVLALCIVVYIKLRKRTFTRSEGKGSASDSDSKATSYADIGDVEKEIEDVEENENGIEYGVAVVY